MSLTEVRPRVVWLSWPYQRRRRAGPVPPPPGSGLSTEDGIELTTEDTPPITLAPEGA